MNADAVDVMLKAGYSPAYGLLASQAEFNAAKALADPATSPARLVLAINALDAQSSGDLAKYSSATAATDAARRRQAEARRHWTMEDAGRQVRRCESEEAYALEAAVESMEDKGQASLRSQLVARLEVAGVKCGGRADTISAYRQLADLIKGARVLRRTMDNHGQGRGGMAGSVPAIRADHEARLQAAGIGSY